jgi:Protein of unknown function (DUF2442)
MMELRTITKVTPLDVGRLELAFDDGVTGTVDVHAMLAIGGVFAPLREPTRWAAVEITDHGHALVWQCPRWRRCRPLRQRPVSDGNGVDFHAISSGRIKPAFFTPTPKSPVTPLPLRHRTAFDASD